MSNRWRFFWVASFSLVIFFQACGMNSWEELFISTADEKRMGREFDSLVRDRNPEVLNSKYGEVLFEPVTQAEKDLYNFYLARGKDMLGVVDEKDIKALLPSEKLCRNNNGADRNQKVTCTKDNFFEFKIIKSTQLNAFAVPGGYVYFYTEILKKDNKNKNGFQSESELMSVMGHEIGHVLLHHSRDRMIKAAGVSAVIQIFLGDGIAGLVGLLGANFWLLDNSRDNESEADVKGFEYTNKLKISSRGLSDFFSRGLKSYSFETGKCDEKKEGSFLDAFSTHPPSCERVNNNKKRMEKVGQNYQMDINTLGGKYFTQLVRDAGI
jgi:Putative Zn-dependent protease, contains TPR repeats